MKSIWTRFGNLFLNLKIQKKLFLLISFILALCFVFTLLVQQYAFHIYDEQIYEKSSQVLNVSSTSIENELHKMERLSYTIMADSQIQQYLRQLKNGLSGYRAWNVSKQLVDRLVYYAGSEPYIRSIQLIDAGGMEHAAGAGAVKTSPQRIRLVRQTIGTADGEHRWVYPDESDPYLVSAREIRSFHNFDFPHLGILMIRFDIEKIVRNVARGAEKNRGDILILADNRVMFPTESLDNGDPAIWAPAPGERYVIREIDGEKLFITRHVSPESGWTYLNVIPFDRIFEKTTMMKKVVMAFILVIFVSVIALGMRFARGITRPIEDLISKMRHVQQGDFDKAEAESASLSRQYMDETGLLHRNFRIMVQRINELIRENYLKQIMIKETEFRALQAQINPHFLYNTLESINWMAKVNRQPEISRMVESLGFLLNQAITVKEHLVSLDEEMEMVNRYVAIQKIRYEERLDFRVSVPPQFRRCRIPKFTIQPLLENAIQYALEPKLEPCTIRLYARREDKGIRLTVEDNGPGMDEQLLDKLRNGEIHTRGKGIGLMNIDERIKLSFGEEYGLSITSHPGQGTKIGVLLPGDREGHHVQSAVGG